jgi:hypothetical protein
VFFTFLLDINGFYLCGLELYNSEHGAVLFVHGRFTVMLKGVNNFIPLILHFFTGLGAVRCSLSALNIVG